MRELASYIYAKLVAQRYVNGGARPSDFEKMAKIAIEAAQAWEKAEEAESIRRRDVIRAAEEAKATPTEAAKNAKGGLTLPPISG